jgi:hypothetical protein
LRFHFGDQPVSNIVGVQIRLGSWAVPLILIRAI